MEVTTRLRPDVATPTHTGHLAVVQPVTLLDALHPVPLYSQGDGPCIEAGNRAGNPVLY